METKTFTISGDYSQLNPTKFRVFVDQLHGAEEVLTQRDSNLSANHETTTVHYKGTSIGYSYYAPRYGCSPKVKLVGENIGEVEKILLEHFPNLNQI